MTKKPTTAAKKKGKKAKLFKVILHATQDEESSLKSKWQALGIPLSLS